jgi:hypothetical protein
MVDLELLVSLMSTRIAAGADIQVRGPLGYSQTT